MIDPHPSVARRACFQALALGLARRIEALFGAEQQKEGFFSSWCVDGHLRNAILELWELGLVSRTNWEGSVDVQLGQVVIGEPGFRCWRLQQASKWERLAVIPDMVSEARLDSLLAVYLGAAIHFGDEASTLTSGRRWFVWPSDSYVELKALVKTGYVEANGTLVRWTDKCCPAMQAIYLWNEEGENCQDIEEREVFEIVDRLLATLPAATVARMREYAAKGDYLDFIGGLKDQFFPGFTWISRDAPFRLFIEGHRSGIVDRELYRRLRT